jgi:hypothetical protein
MKKPAPGLSDQDKESVVAAHTEVNRLAAEIETNRPGPFELVAYVEKFRAAVEPLLPLIADPAQAEPAVEAPVAETPVTEEVA